METKNIIIAVVSGIIILIIGFSLGFWYKSISQPKNVAQEIPEAVKVISSKVTPSITAYGVITKIDGKNITINNEGDIMTITARDDVKIYAFSSTTGKSQEITLNDLKIGDKLSVNIKVSDSGQVDAYTIIVLPPVVKK
ncbi:MAG: hypothetical protein A3F47_01895 [Candidatus Staskawiczbacteria bacterium RIFCSPHIGHO2_12_FULL_38_11]|uniref:DUF5666 domain-containing protein n=1 Tax=Candidatus Staskawiczbacteria bacterium RIFCSPHIGHO2_12_FULL_38_11 TaxID=1802209 RepID=A0A1G2I8K6_9BACT|nr:MAG: hypothetical protein A3F47_01895 [Candidatus Staskawiczbacteria bacterium RIFCSPHIGHO2_12_FULL_38_11]